MSTKEMMFGQVPSSVYHQVKGSMVHGGSYNSSVNYPLRFAMCWPNVEGKAAWV